MPQRRVRHHVNPFSITHEVHFEGFENNNPIWMDIGSCKGEFVYELAQKFPEKNFIACEIRQPLVKKLRELYKDLPNVRVFDGDAGKNFQNLLKPSFDKGILLEKVFVNFPDPWFKEKHKKRRFINPVFLENSQEFLTSDTEIIFQTDQKFLFDETIEIVEESAFNNVSFFSEPLFGVRTKWEKGKIAEGDEIYRMIFRKNS